MGSINSCVRTVFVGLALAGLAGVTVAQTTQKADESRIQKLVGDLGDKDFNVRQGATSELSAIGPDALPALKKAATSSDPEVAQRAKTILSQIAKTCFDAGSKQIQKNLLWNYPVKDGLAGRINIKDGVAYVAGLDHALHAVDIKTGKENWSQAKLSEDAAVTVSGALVSDKAALALLDNGDVTGLDLSNGKVKWNYKRERPAEPLPPVNPGPGAGVGGGVGPGAMVVIGGGANGPVGVIRAFGQEAKPAPAVVGSVLYLPQEDAVVLVNTETGTKVKEIKVASPSMGTPIISGERMIIHLSDGTVRGYSLSDGSEAWQHAGGGLAASVICSEGKAYFVGDLTTMFALDCATGKEVWHCSTAAEETDTGAGPGVGMRPNHVIAGMISTSALGQPLTIKDGTVYTLQGSSLIAVDAKEGKKKWQQQIDVWRDETPVMTPGGRQMRAMFMIARPRLLPGLGQTASPFVIDGNIAYVNGGQLGIYAVSLDDGSALWGLRTNMAVGDMVLLDGVLYFGTSQQGMVVGRPMLAPVAGGAAPAKPVEDTKDALPEGLHALKVK